MRTTRCRQRAGSRLAVVALAAPLALVLLGGTASAAAPADLTKGAAASPASPAAAAPGQAAKAERAADASAAAAAQTGAPGKAEAPAAKAEKPAAPGRAAKAATPASRPAGEHPGTSGTATSPQPLSKADRNGTGANPGETCAHAYCSTRDGSPSGNGNGGGEATGKPCAGCVGKADNKNPPGQAPDGSDHNAGYECDRNKGIGRTNPAHTGCRTVVTEEPPAVTCATNPALPGCPTGQTCATNPALPGCPSGQTCATNSALPGCTPTTGTEVLPRGLTPGLVLPFEPTASAGPAVLSRGADGPAQARPTVLPFTGSDMTGLLPLALSFVAFGAALVRGGRTRWPALR